MHLFLLFLLVLLTVGVILLLHRYQLKNRTDIVDRTAPLAALELSLEEPATPAPGSANPPLPDVPVFVAAAGAPDAGGGDNWQEQVKQLRESHQDERALALCRQHFPRIQAYQLAAIVLRQLIRTQVEARHTVSSELRELYRIAVMADLYRNSNPLKPKDARRALQHLQQREFDYNAIGTRQLRLLTKSDTRHFEQLWGRPKQHQHAEDCPGIDWASLCQ